MNLNNRALMTAGGIGVGVRILFALCGSLVDFAPLAVDDTAALAALGTGLLVLCACNWIIAVGIGFAYAFFAARDGAVAIGDGAIGGAIATAVAGLIGGLLSACSTAVAPFVTTPDFATDALMANIGGIVGVICGGLIGGAIVGAIGGAIGAATVGKKSAGAA
jgi:hypothetical protein